MTLLTTTLSMPNYIAHGLASGKYTRIGGVIQEADTGKIVMWLREVPGAHQAVSQVGDLLPSLGGVASVLNLGMTTLGFVVVLARLNELEGRLQIVQQMLKQIDRKLDISFYANVRAAVDLAMNAFSMNSAKNREASALQAINRFAEAHHHYMALVDLELQQRTQVVDEYLATLMLIYITEARCYLELEEIDTAQRLLQNSVSVVDTRVRQHVQTLLTSNPAAYLHPLLCDTIDLGRLTHVLRWLDPALTDERAVFEAQRENLFTIARGTDPWIQSLPPAIWDPSVDLPNRSVSIPVFGAVYTPSWASSWLSSEESTENKVLKRLPGAMQTIEGLIEDLQRFAGYQLEVQALQQLQLPFNQWQHLLPPVEEPADQAQIMYIVAHEPVHIASR